MSRPERRTTVGGCTHLHVRGEALRGYLEGVLSTPMDIEVGSRV